MNKVVCVHHVGSRQIRMLQGDITLAETDAIVNAANSRLLHGGGVAAAIVRRGGYEIQQESQEIGFCAEGDAVVTGGGKLAARFVIHAVGPRGSDPQGDGKLASAVKSSLQRAEELGLSSISIPAISSGIFGFPKDRCAQILLATARAYLEQHEESSLEHVDFVVYDDPTLACFVHEWERCGWSASPGHSH